MAESLGFCSRMRVLLARVARRGMRRWSGPADGASGARDGLRVSHSEACCQARPGLSCHPRECTSVVIEVAPVVSTPLIVVSSLEKTYATRGRTQVHALAGISVEIAAGEFITIVGQSGCGKTTLLKILAGLLQRSAGSVTLRGQSVDEPSRDIGIVFQDPVLLLMDEPFGALDAMTREFMNLELLRIWKESGKTIVFITHSIPEAAFLADRVIVMSARPGRIKEIVEVRLPRPRDLDMMASDEFGVYTRRIRHLFDARGWLD